METVEHLFRFCPVVKTFWFKLFDVILLNREININLNDVEVLLGVPKIKIRTFFIIFSQWLKSISIIQNVKNSNLVSNVV